MTRVTKMFPLFGVKGRHVGVADHQLYASITQPVLVSEQLIFICNWILALICRHIM